MADTHIRPGYNEAGPTDPREICQALTQIRYNKERTVADLSYHNYIQIVKPEDCPRGLSPDDCWMIKKLYAKGMSIKRLILLFGVPEDTIVTVLANQGPRRWVKYNQSVI